MRSKINTKDIVFTRAAHFNAACLIGDKTINVYDRERQVRCVICRRGKDAILLLSRGCLVLSIRILAIAEHGIEERNLFFSIYMSDEVQEERQTISLDSLRRIQFDCIVIDEKMLWMLALFQ